tara:strand:+ start:6384 stop:6788 length:405 start_codon:yes stop_codon:yes gene_type:complete
VLGGKYGCETVVCGYVDEHTSCTAILNCRTLTQEACNRECDAGCEGIPTGFCLPCQEGGVTVCYEVEEVLPTDCRENCNCEDTEGCTYDYDEGTDSYILAFSTCPDGCDCEGQLPSPFPPGGGPARITGNCLDE